MLSIPKENILLWKIFLDIQKNYSKKNQHISSNELLMLQNENERIYYY